MLTVRFQPSSLAQAVVLTTNGYLRLDPNVLHYPIHEAGTFLARYGMPEVAGCIDGLRQYGASYEECYTQADALQVSFDRSRAAAAAAAQQQHAHGHPASFVSLSPAAAPPALAPGPQPHRLTFAPPPGIPLTFSRRSAGAMSTWARAPVASRSTGRRQSSSTRRAGRLTPPPPCP